MSKKDNSKKKNTVKKSANVKKAQAKEKERVKKKAQPKPVKDKESKAVKKNNAKKNNKEANILTRFFSHNITLMVLSFILAFTIWFVISMSSETDSNVKIDNIPITIELPESAQQDGLEVFEMSPEVASVEVSGNRVTVGSLSSSDIQIIAGDTSTINAPNTYILPLSAKKTSIKTNYDIVSAVTPLSVKAFVDKRKEATYSIEESLNIHHEEGYYISKSLSQNKVTLNGPETQINQIDKVAVIGDIDVGSDSSKTLQLSLTYLDSEGKTLDFPLVKADVDTIDATIKIMPEMTVRLDVESVGQPKNCPDIKITPATIKIAGPQTSLSEIREGTVIIGKLDFSKLKNAKNTNMYDIALPTGCENLSEESTATVSVDLSGYSKTTVDAKITPVIDTDNYDATKYSVTLSSNTVSLEIYGPEKLTNKITSASITAEADVTEIISKMTSDNASSKSVQLSISFTDAYAECWVYGTYNVTVTVSEK